jgi:hypothetical protein
VQFRFPLIIAGFAACVAAPLVESPARAEVRSIAASTAESPGRPDPLLITTGAMLFGIPYGLSVWSGAVSTNSSDHWLYAPVFGPLADLIARQTCSSTGCIGNVAGDTGPLVVSGLMQTAGLAVLVTAFVSPSRPPPSSSSFAVRVAPTTYRGGGGVTAFGAF